MSQQPETRSVTLTRVFDAPIQLVFDAWTKPEHMTQWMKCSPDVKTTLAEWSPRVGGTFEYHMAQEGVFEAKTTGRYLQFDPPDLLEYVIDANEELGSPEMTVRVALREVEKGTELTLKHSGIPGHFEGMIDAGWGVSLDLLKDLVLALFSAYAGTRMSAPAKVEEKPESAKSDEQADV